MTTLPAAWGPAAFFKAESAREGKGALASPRLQARRRVRPLRTARDSTSRVLDLGAAAAEPPTALRPCQAAFRRIRPSSALTVAPPGVYRAPMTRAAPSFVAAAAEPGGARHALPSGRQLVNVVVGALIAAAALLPITHNTYVELMGETLFVGVMLLFAFTAAGAWRQRRVPQWIVQVAAVTVAAAVSPLIVQLLTFRGDFAAFIASRPHVHGYLLVTVVAAVVGTLSAVAALYAERARTEALRFALERETLERQAADARLALLTAQIEPHFLLNTLANVQELIESGSPQAVPVFRNLIAYLRACMPRLQQADATLADEARLVRAYLELMHLRMPDRLSFDVAIDADLAAMRFPPMALLTLVENAVRHGIDPGCDGGRIDVGAARADASTVHLWVADTGVGLADHAGEGQGLANLKARLRAFFGEAAAVELSEQAPHGVRADIRLPVPA
jgi:signal transduction histidine kinase